MVRWAGNPITSREPTRSACRHSTLAMDRVVPPVRMARFADSPNDVDEPLEMRQRSRVLLTARVWGDLAWSRAVNAPDPLPILGSRRPALAEKASGVDLRHGTCWLCPSIRCPQGHPHVV